MKLLIPIILLLFLTACTPPECEKDSECIAPVEFIMQSNCPYGAVCDEGECKVVCPMTYFNHEESRSYAYTCEKDKECDCEGRGNRSLECICHKNKCLSVEG
ncbi:hypothetical protein KY362_05765 [Candidatus Woesearchaeota archaeon]|nr:hypothetical protein [Candidatus Woesearchaeota archaeon]